MEAMPFSCDTSNWPSGSNSSTALYALDHNLFTYYSSTRTTAACQNNIPVAAPSTIPVQASPADPFANDMSAGGLPDFISSFRTTAMRCTPSARRMGDEPDNADAWLKYNLPTIQASSWYAQGGIVIVTWDEADNPDDSAWVNGGLCPSLATSPFCGGNPVKTGGHIPTIIISAANKASTRTTTAPAATSTGSRARSRRTRRRPPEQDIESGNGDLLPAFGAVSSGCIGGTVTDGTATGHPVLAGVTVACSCQPARDHECLRQLLVRQYHSRTVQPPFNNNRFVTQVFSSVSVTAGNTTTQNAALVEDGSITGQVTDATSHAAIANATVTCTCQTGNELTNSSGNYAFTNIAPGTSYTMTFSATGHATTTINNVTVLAGQVTTENAALGPALGGITGTVTDGTTAGHPVLPGVTVACSCSGTNETTNSSGIYTFSNIASGWYSLTFSD